MKKEEIYVVIDNEEKRLRAIQILTDAGEKIWDNDLCWEKQCENDNLAFDVDSKEWFVFSCGGTEITLYQLEQLFNLKQEIKLDALKLIAESYGFELVEKKR